MSIPDLALKSVEVVEPAKQPELATWNLSPSVGNPYLFLKVSFASNINLPNYLAENSYAVGNTAIFCDSSQDREMAHASWSGVYHDGVKVEGYGTDSAIKGTGPFAYYSFFAISRPANLSFVRGRALPAYDLRQRAVDLCFELRGGGAPSPFGYRSNTVRIPAASIEAALKHSAQ